MRIVSNGVQPYIVQTGVDTDGETQEEVTTFRMKLDVSEWAQEMKVKRGSMERAKAKAKGKVSKVKDTVMVTEVNMGKKDMNIKEKSESSKPETI
ncbi:hypothetical protein DPX16_2132 [Anabarilius grahami]|uniref:Uncharacterized protein n=1 Tax=Anabarilius grahami TaxID=495550 RepID=A0A3N0XLW5_ANAGA|nr:hypothetical protein DPX16_2132 [Anabarilius grahami]